MTTSVDELLAGYKTLNDQLAKSNELNEKIFRELTLAKVRKSLSHLLLIEIVGGLCGIFLLLFSIYAIINCSDSIDLLLMSITMFVLVLAMVFLFYKSVKGRVFAKTLLNENDLLQTLASVREYERNLVNQRKLTVPFIFPIYILGIPVMWYVNLNKHYTEVIEWHLHNNQWYLPYIVFSMIFGVFIAWKSYEWMYFPALKSIERNLKALEE